MSVSNPLAVQVGGTHYKSLAIQPIVFATANGYDPSAYSILKYVTRWRSKNGLQDLEKALHFAQLRRTPEIASELQPARAKIAMAEYLSKNDIPSADSRILTALSNWVYITPGRAWWDEAADLVQERLQKLIDQERSKNG